MGERTAADRAIEAIVALAIERLGPRRIWLFGSRARGDARRTSDIDLAFELERESGWPSFVADAEESAPTLVGLDLVDIARCGPELRSVILREGVLLHER